MRVRCSYRGDHVGTVLCITDPRAWEGSIAFESRQPSQEAVCAHVAWCLDQGLLRDSLPVLWDFGRVYWDRASSLSPAL